tara:strand:+ start:1385 stop:2224 length:840 start_codon:yes stop_codon:yes gene_type:complete
MKKKLSTVAGVTLIEILIGILISVVMMAAMYTSYSVVNSTYSQVSDRAKISSAGRDVVGMMLRDIRNAGYKYFNDNIPTTDELSPILITKSSSFGKSCDKLEIVTGDVDYDQNRTPKYQYERYKITYECKASTIPDKSAAVLSTGGYPPIKAFALYKSKLTWDNNTKKWKNPTTDGNNKTYNEEIVLEYVSDLVFNAIDDNGYLIDPPPSPTNATKDKLYNIKIVDIALSVRSSKEFYRTSKLREIFAMTDSKRNLKNTDKFLRETIVVSAHARNLGLQ